MDVIDKPKEANVAKATNEVSPDDLFKNEFNDLEDDFNKQMFNDKAQNQDNNLFGQSITKEIL